MDDRARNHEPLALAAGERRGPVRHHGVHPHRHRLDVVGEARCFRAMADSLENLPVSVKLVDERRPLAVPFNGSSPSAMSVFANDGVCSASSDTW